jgi:hypothetical protein
MLIGWDRSLRGCGLALGTPESGARVGALEASAERPRHAQGKSDWFAYAPCLREFDTSFLIKIRASEELA